jgi:rod shape-determining protein MreD
VTAAGSLRGIMPAASVALVTLLAALPWGLPSAVQVALPLLPYSAIHYWAVRRPALMPEWLIFLTGLATDALTHGPLGFWSLIYLFGLVVSRALGHFAMRGALGRWLQFCGTIVVLALLQWLVASTYAAALSHWVPLVQAALTACLLYPLVSLLLRPFNRLWLAAETPRLQRPGA